jgi:hypothetical protein
VSDWIGTFGEKRRHLRSRERFAEIETQVFVATPFGKPCALILGFNAFGRRLHAEFACEADDRADDRGRIRVSPDIARQGRDAQ